MRANKYAVPFATFLLVSLFAAAQDGMIIRSSSGVSSIAVTAPVTSTGGATPTISMTPASASTSGYLPLVGGVLVVDAGFTMTGVNNQLDFASGTGTYQLRLFGAGGTSDGIRHYSNTIRMQIGGSEILQVASTGVINPLSGFLAAGGYTSSAGSASNAVAVSTNGARIDHGAGASDYSSSDGTTVTHAGPVAITNKLTISGQTTATLETNVDSNFVYFGGGNWRSATSNIYLDVGTIDLAGSAASLKLASRVTFSTTAPITPVACTSPTITSGTVTSFLADVGTGCTTENTFVFTAPTPTVGWLCHGENITTPTTRYLAQSAGFTLGTITMTNYSRTLGTAQAFVAGDDVRIVCTGG